MARINRSRPFLAAQTPHADVEWERERGFHASHGNRGAPCWVAPGAVDGGMRTYLLCDEIRHRSGPSAPIAIEPRTAIPDAVPDAWGEEE